MTDSAETPTTRLSRAERTVENRLRLSHQPRGRRIGQKAVKDQENQPFKSKAESKTAAAGRPSAQGGFTACALNLREAPRCDTEP